jgi:hypothetical protein
MARPRHMSFLHWRHELRATGRRRSLCVLAAALVMAGCAAPAAQVSQGPSGSLGGASSASAAPPTPTSTASPTSEPTATPPPALAFEAPAGVLPPRSLAIVVMDGLRIREEASLTGRVVASAGASEVVYRAFAGPVVADGVDWYEVVFLAGYRDWPVYPTPAPGASGIPGLVQGWAAIGSGEARYLELQPPRCPSAAPDLAGLARLTEWEQLACFGDPPLTLEGTYGGCDACGGTSAGTFEPGWLVSPFLYSLLSVNPEVKFGDLLLHFAPQSGIVEPARASIVRVTGHFNDPASSTCVIGLAGAEEINRPMAELYCRERFVVDTYEVIGTDPDFQYPPAP